MTENWRSISLRDFVSLQRGHDLPTGQRGNGNIPVAGSNGIVGFHDKSIGIIPGVTIGRSGSIGNTQFFEDKYFPLNTTLYITDFQGNDAKFVYYFFSRFDFLQFDSGSVQPSLNRNFLYTAQVDIPPIPEQKAIAHILGTLDDKIELNRKTNKTLEGIAKALFKSWFIDFDPVRAKAECRSTGLSDEISELFPDSFEDSELGEIPSGWRLDFLSNHLSITKGRSYKSIELQDSLNALVTLKSFQRGGGYRADGLKPYTGIYKEDQIVVAGELVIALTDVTQSADVIGRPAIVRSNESYQKLIASLDVGILRMKPEGSLAKEYIFELLKTANYVSHALSFTSGTTVLHLAKGVFESFQVVIPSIEIVERFASLSKGILEKIDMNEVYSKTLEKLRDTLLPKLISGELKVPEAEKMIEEVGI